MRKVVLALALLAAIVGVPSSAEAAPRSFEVVTICEQKGGGFAVFFSQARAGDAQRFAIVGIMQEFDCVPGTVSIEVTPL